MVGAPVHNLGEGFQRILERTTLQGGQGEWPPKIRHFHDNVGPTHFAKVVGWKMLSISTNFCPYLDTVSRKIILKINIDCSGMMKVKDVKGTISMDQGWPIFSIAHDANI
jgi:hypothetical protein